MAQESVILDGPTLDEVGILFHPAPRRITGRETVDVYHTIHLGHCLDREAYV
jgi:hypothetical protein